MELTLKNFKHSPFASQETNCFQAKLYVDGKPLCLVTNEGHGGCDHYYPIKSAPGAQATLYERIKEIEQELGKQKIKTAYGDMSNCLEIEVGKLVNDQIMINEAKRELKKIMIHANEHKVGEFFTVKGLKPTPENIAKVKKYSWYKDDYIVLNELPIETAMEYIFHV